MDHGQVINVTKLAKIAVIIPDSRELGRESGFALTASTARKIVNN
jgi:hypothetical protein